MYGGVYAGSKASIGWSTVLCLEWHGSEIGKVTLRKRRSGNVQIPVVSSVSSPLATRWQHVIPGM